MSAQPDGGGAAGEVSSQGGTAGEAAGVSGDTGAGAPSAGGESGGGAAGSGGDGPLGPCGAAWAPPAMVQIETEFGSFCIDSSEVTWEQYGAFLQASPTLGLVPTECLWKPSFTPFPATGDVPKEPVSGVDWCDAYAYCNWAGKRLCGRMGGGAALPIDLSLDEQGEWRRACSGAEDNVYPYGNVYDQFECIGNFIEVGRPLPLEARDDVIGVCEGSYAGVFDLSGNIAEWENSCTAGDQFAECAVRGGFFGSSELTLRCDGSDVPFTRDRSFRDNQTGIRCCSSAD